MKHPLCDHQFLACIGLDWADAQQDSCWRAGHDETVESCVLAHLKTLSRGRSNGASLSRVRP